MPNIMLTYRCNLHCSYCFANEFVNKEKTDITIHNFLKALSFLTRTGQTHVGLIGGEPTLHPGFQTIMELLIAHPLVADVMLYTNGLLMDRFVSQITNPKIRILVNCNSPLIIGEKAFSVLQQNLDTMILQHNMKDRIWLGINLYSNDMDYSCMMDLLQRYEYHHVRISLTVPDFSVCSHIDIMDHFKKRKSFLMEFFRKMDSIGVMAFFDCNSPPSCIWSEDEKKWLDSYAARCLECNSDLTGQSNCLPVIDILPNLQAVRCFGMSDFTKVPIADFVSVHDIIRYFQNEIDSVAYKLPACEDCKSCYEKKVRHCLGGCIGFKSSRVHSCNEAINQL